jgi:hypothetical protein
MKSLAVLLALLALCLPAFAADVAVILDDSKAGTYLVTIDAQGVVTAVPLKIVRVNKPTPTPTPQPPGPVVLTDRAKAIKAATESLGAIPNRDETAKKLAMLYREIAKTARDKIKDQATLASLVSQSTTMLLGDDLAKWKPVRDKLREQWDPLVQEGRSVGDYATLLEEAASGLEASSVSLKAGISPETLEMILDIIKLVLKLLNL